MACQGDLQSEALHPQGNDYWIVVSRISTREQPAGVEEHQR